MKKVIFLGLLALIMGGCTSNRTPTPTPAATPTPTATASPTEMVEVPKKMTISLAEENNSGQKGTAVIEVVDNGVKVIITMSGKKYSEPQPTHIHIGKCPGVGAVKYPLTSIVNGKSTTMLAVSMATLVTGEPLALNVHKSDKEASVYTACGQLE